MTRPAPGQIVTFVTPYGEDRPALVVGLEAGDALTLSIFTDGTRDSRWTFQHPKWQPHVPYSAEPKPETWRWGHEAAQPQPPQPERG